METENYNSKGEPILTPEQDKFFSKRRSMESVWKELFSGDVFAANNFQNWAQSNNLITWNGSTFFKTK